MVIYGIVVVNDLEEDFVVLDKLILVSPQYAQQVANED